MLSAHFGRKRMISNPTVFVVGAGASNEVGLPLGGQLAADIGEDLDFHFDDAGLQDRGDHKLYSYLRDAFGDRMKALVHSGYRLRSILPTFPSIDEALHYLSSEQNAVDLGKMC